jgi:hypothetical protein
MAQRKTRGITLSITAIAALLLFVWGDAFMGKYSVCLYNQWLGIPCPFCGLTRAVYEIMHLRFVSAYLYNPLVFLLILWYAIELAYFIANNNHMLYTFLKIYRWLLAGMTLLLLILRWFRYFPLP